MHFIRPSNHLCLTLCLHFPLLISITGILSFHVPLAPIVVLLLASLSISICRPPLPVAFPTVFPITSAFSSALALSTSPGPVLTPFLPPFLHLNLHRFLPLLRLSPSPSVSSSVSPFSLRSTALDSTSPLLQFVRPIKSAGRSTSGLGALELLLVPCIDPAPAHLLLIGCYDPEDVG
ncbi:Transcription factor RAX3-like [Lasiodiplodia theobromae]|uniref:Transcription factor RAX3-like n=1 Tax=Lasiodiplodia theobromae TaxID=45133 RepID=UPI0015C3B025|nr:Transcription factor RAX3-like [Lasiodiplodia theobromae]KAF4544989.1 Transcription factor RAX3-like [Lasiodiplodia theobromae]